MGIKLHDVSPAAAMFTGKGGMGKLMSKGYVGLLPAAIAKKAQKDTEEKERMQAEAASYSSQPTGRKDGTPAPVQMKKAVRFLLPPVVLMAALLKAKPRAGWSNGRQHNMVSRTVPHYGDIVVFHS
jgi:hypothetical protein